ncbi:hypothetical protein [Powai lake megavirus]|uniref:Uncharacterized protein n=1 Tax=Powai lake megavirus TaxID=1842663 RepID=A0A167RHX4_9VIRU|nr:hypothetical protein QJ849_gp542 [Powai lake megavirus]ANB50704.1 hypothetical protein [Powai lake megavirus]
MILIFIILAIVLYFFYQNIRSCKSTENFKKTKNMKNKSKKIQSQKTKKKVRFNDDIEYNIYSDKSSTDIMASPYRTSDSIYDTNKIDVDIVLSQISSDSVMSNESSISNRSPHDDCINNKVVPSNLPFENAEDLWHSSFGKPLLSQNEKNKFSEKIKQDHQEYEKCLGQFSKYQMDNNTIIKTDVTIDPFKKSDENKLKNIAVKDIYDSQVAGPRIKSKNIKTTNNHSTIYEDESEMNGGYIKGTQLHGFDGTSNFKSAAFDSEF